MKKRLSIILILSLMLIGCSLYAFASEENIIMPQRINLNNDINYLYIDELLSFDAFDTVYFSSKDNLYKNTKIIFHSVSSVTFFQDKMLYCSNEGIYYNDNLLKSGEYSQITVLTDKLYASSNDTVFVFDIEYNAESDTFSLSKQEKIYQFSNQVSNLCASSQAIYIKLNQSNQIYKIYGGHSGVVGEVEGLKAISAALNSNLIFCLTGSKVISFEDSGDVLNPKNNISLINGEKITAGKDKVFVAVAEGETYSILSSSFELSEFKGFIASRGDYDYFYRSPMGISSRYNNIYVADTKNNRVCIINDQSITYITHYQDDENILPYYEPKAAALSLSGELFIAHKNKLTNHNTGKTLQLLDQTGRALIIEKLVIDSKGNIFVLGVHSLSQDSFIFKTDIHLNEFSALSFNKPTAIGYKAGGEVLVYDDGAVKNINGVTFRQCQQLKDFCADLSGKIFGINLDGNLISVGKEGEKNHGGNYDRITISNINCEFCSYGDLLLINSQASSLLKISALDAGVADASEHYPVPDVENENTPHIKMQNTIATLKGDAPLFDLPNESTSSYILEKDSVVFIRYDVDTPEDMYFVIAEKLTGSPQTAQEVVLIYGYVYRSALNQPLEFALPPKNTARVFIDVGEYKYIYKYPSLKANKVGQVSKGDWVKPLDFAVNKNTHQGRWYEDISLNKWVRVAIGDCEGYMLELGLSWSLFSSSASQPNTNATIKKDAPLYVYNAATQKYELLDGMQFLEKGKRVEVKTPFDSSAKYTKVVFSIKNENGTIEVIDIECYVETKYIDYDGVDILELIAFSAIALCALLLIFLFVWTIKKRNQISNRL